MSDRTKAVKEADKAFGEYIRARDGKCIVCGTRENLTCGHLFSRVNYSTRWSEVNSWGQCFACNLRHEHDWEPMRRAVLQIIGEEAYERLYREHRTVRKISTGALRDLARTYREATRRLEAERRGDTPVESGN